MRRRSARKEIEPRPPYRIRVGGGVAVEVSGANRRDRTPEDVAVFAVPAGNQGIRHGYVQEREEVRVLGERQRSFGGDLQSNPVPVKWGVACPEQDILRLVGGPR